MMQKTISTAAKSVDWKQTQRSDTVVGEGFSPVGDAPKRRNAVIRVNMPVEINGGVG